MTLTGAAPTNGLTIALSSNSATATVPQTVTVPAGDTTAPFPITTTPTETTTVATLSAVHGEVTKTADLTVEAQTPPVPLELQSLTLSRASIVGGRSATGRVTLTAAAPAGGIEVALSSDGSSASVPAVVTVLEGRSSATFSISTTAVSASATATIAAAYAGVTKTAQLRVTPRFEITNISNGDVLSGYVQVDVAVYDGAIGIDQVELKIDGISTGSSDPQRTTGTHRSMFFRIPTKEFANGTHVLTVEDNINSDTRTVEFRNDIMNLNYASIFDTSGANDVPGVARIMATVASPSDSPYWKVEIKNDIGGVVKTFAGSVSVANPIIDVSWDGKDGSGMGMANGTYEGTIVLSAVPFAGGATTLSSSSSRTRTRRRRIKAGRSRMQIASAGDPDGDGWVPLPPGNPDVLINKHQFADHLIIIDMDAVAGGWPKANEYAKHIRNRCAGFLSLDDRNSVQTIVVNRSRMNADNPSYPWGSGAFLRARIRNQFKEPLKLVYVLAHGAGIHPGFHVGNHFFVSVIHPEDSTYYNNRYPGHGKEFYNDISQLTADLHYGEPDGERQPTLVWIDACYSAGPFPPTDPSDPPDNTYNGLMARAFGIDGLGWGASMGSYTDKCVVYADGGPNGSQWVSWRHMMWDKLQFYNVGTAYDRTNALIPSIGNGEDPHAIIKLYGVRGSLF